MARGPFKRPKRAGPCKHCGRTHHTRCWKQYEEKKKLRKAAIRQRARERAKQNAGAGRL